MNNDNNLQSYFVSKNNVIQLYQTLITHNNLNNIDIEAKTFLTNRLVQIMKTVFDRLDTSKVNNVNLPLVINKFNNIVITKMNEIINNTPNLENYKMMRNIDTNTRPNVISERPSYEFKGNSNDTSNIDKRLQQLMDARSLDVPDRYHNRPPTPDFSLDGSGKKKKQQQSQQSQQSQRQMPQMNQMLQMPQMQQKQLNNNNDFMAFNNDDDEVNNIDVYNTGIDFNNIKEDDTPINDKLKRMQQEREQLDSKFNQTDNKQKQQAQQQFQQQQQPQFQQQRQPQFQQQQQPQFQQQRQPQFQQQFQQQRQPQFQQQYEDDDNNIIIAQLQGIIVQQKKQFENEITFLKSQIVNNNSNNKELQIQASEAAQIIKNSQNIQRETDKKIELLNQKKQEIIEEFNKLRLKHTEIEESMKKQET